MYRARLVLCLPFMLAACFSSTQEPADSEDATESSGDGDGDSGDGDGDATNGDGDGEGDGDGDTTTGDGDGEATEGQDLPPTLENFTVAGSANPPKLIQSQVTELSVEVEDDIGVDEVEFFEDGISLGFGSTTPQLAGRYVFDYIVSGETFDGLHVYTAEARDTGGNATQSEEVELEIDVPPSGTMLWDLTLNPTSSADRIRDCHVTPDGQVALAGYFDDEGVVAFYEALTGIEVETWTKAGNDEAWKIDEIEPGADGTGIVIAQSQNDPLDFLEVVRYDEGGQELWNSGSIAETDNTLFGVGAQAMETTSDLIYVGARAGNGSPTLIILDMQSGVEQCRVDIETIDFLRGMVALEGGDVVLGGGDLNNGWVARYSSQCEEVWAQTTLDNSYNDLWLTQSGTVLAASSGTNPGLDGAVREFSVEGVPGTVYYIDYNGGRDEINAIGQTPTGLTVLAGYVESNEQFDTDFYVRAEQPLGNLVWDIEPIQGPAASADNASTLCLDRAGNIFVGGSLNFEGGIGNSGWHVIGFTP